ncbi:hypothetical protein HYZ78_04125 [Candidatus Microgenomates bacterium]|nr:hypothetical protein [Candidatus Microgenomates bacterium]
MIKDRLERFRPTPDMAISREVSLETESIYLSGETKVYVAKVIIDSLFDGNELLFNIWSRMLASESDTNMAELEGSALTYDNLQEERKRKGKPTLVIENRILQTIYNDRIERRETVGLLRIHEVDEQDFHILFENLKETCPDFHRMARERTDYLALTGKTLQRLGFLTGIREV